jgi:signal transduction histidine kinase
MAPSRLLLAFAVAAFLPLAGMRQESTVFLFPHSENPQVLGNIGAAKCTHKPEHQIFGESVEASVLFREPVTWGSHRAYMILAGVAILLAQAALIILLVLQMRRRIRSDQTIRSLTRRLIHVGEEERTHLARELHDDIGQRLSLVSVELGSLNWNRATSRQDGNRKLEQALEELQTLISDVHGLSHRLHSSKLEHLGLEDALKELCQQITQRHDLEIGLQMNEVRAGLDREISLCFYRVAQEALSNIVRHSSSSRATVRLAASRGMLRLQVKDDGTGFDPSKTPVGLGLVTMEERLRLIGGTLSVASKPGEGTTVTAQVSPAPLNRQKGNEANKRVKAPTR